MWYIGVCDNFFNRIWVEQKNTWPLALQANSLSVELKLFVVGVEFLGYFLLRLFIKRN